MLTSSFKNSAETNIGAITVNMGMKKYDSILHTAIGMHTPSLG